MHNANVILICIYILCNVYVALIKYRARQLEVCEQRMAQSFKDFIRLSEKLKEHIYMYDIVAKQTDYDKKKLLELKEDKGSVVANRIRLAAERERTKYINKKIKERKRNHNHNTQYMCIDVDIHHYLLCVCIYI